MVIRDSTHALTALTLNNYYPGYSLPILECAAGRAYIAFAPDDEREVIIRDIKSSGAPSDDWTMKMLQSGVLIEDVRSSGYAVKGRNQFTQTPGKTSSIARPVHGLNGIAGSIVLIFFSSAMKIDEAISKYGEALRIAAERISEDLIETEAEAMVEIEPTTPPKTPLAISRREAQLEVVQGH
jgi:IclR family mhp operon transcriptional activator